LSYFRTAVAGRGLRSVNSDRTAIVLGSSILGCAVTSAACAYASNTNDLNRVAYCRTADVETLIHDVKDTGENAAVAVATTPNNVMIKSAGLGATLGFATGYFVKKIGRMMLIVVGAQFVFLQTLAWFNIIDIHWSRFVALDNDPRATTVNQLSKRGESKLVALLTHNLPFKVPFMGAFYVGFRMG
jgi:uncharacterized membrane protein (Fun14 family)